MSSIRRRLLLSILIITAVAVALPALVTGRFVGNELDRQEDNAALSRARLAATALNRVSAESSGHDPVASLNNLEWMKGMVKEAGATGEVRITVFGRDGALLAASPTDGLSDVPAVRQPEVDAGLTGRSTVSRRSAPGLDDTWLYAAVPLDEGESPWSEGVLRVALPAHQDSAARADLWRFPLLIGILLLLPAALLAYRLSSGLLEPVEHIMTMSKEVTEGDLTYRVGTRGEDELAHLGRSLNSMMDNIQERMDKLISAEEEATEVLATMNDGVLILTEGGHVINANQAAARMLGMTTAELKGNPIVRKARAFPALDLIEQARSATESISRQIEMPGNRHFFVQAIPLTPSAGHPLRILLMFRDETDRIRVENMRRDFVTNVSHELKTPLSGLSLLARTLQHATEEDPDAAQRFIDRLIAETDRLNALVGDLLTLSQLDERDGPDREDWDLVDFSALVAQAGADLQEKSAEKGLELQVETEEGIDVLGDRIELHQLVRNLLDNAVRYTDRGGRVSVRLEQTDDRESAADGGPAQDRRAVLTVEDTGVGIPRDQLDRIFERFYRVDKARSRDTGGTGLGLSIARHAARRHGGSVTVESTAGVGSTFTVELPAA